MKNRPTQNEPNHQMYSSVKPKHSLTRWYLLCIFALTLFVLLSASVAQADSTPESAQGSDAHNQLIDRPPFVPLEKILNPSMPLKGSYPIHTSGVYAGDWFWMDNHKIIFWTYEQSQTAKDVITGDIAKLVGPQKTEQYHLYPSLVGVTKIWDVDGGNITRYRVGKVSCYQDGIINIHIREKPPGTGILMTGPMGQEKPIDIASKPRWYMYRGDCGDQPSAVTKKYMEDHPEEYVKPLRKEDGFIVLGIHEYKNRGSALPQNFVVFHRTQQPSLTLQMNNDLLLNDDYFDFANAYLFLDRHMIAGDFGKPPRFELFIHILRPNGELREIKKPDALSGKEFPVPLLSRRGVLWRRDAVTGDPGIYISRGNEVKEISPDSVVNGKVSPDGCRFAYLQVERNQLPLQGKLKVIDLCEGVQ